MSDLAINELIRKRDELNTERERHYREFSDEIERLDIAIAMLSGKSPKEIVEQFKYDDENPNYIRNNEDGI